MNLNQVIHTRWAAATALEALLPVASVVTGINIAETSTFPYGTLERPSDGERSYTNDGATQDVTVRVTVYHGRDNYDEGRAIAEAVKDAFDRTSFDLAGADKVLAMRLTGTEELQDEGDDWVFLLDFNCHIYLG